MRDTLGSKIMRPALRYPTPNHIPGCVLWMTAEQFQYDFQDSAGTTPVTATGQPVGLVLDKSLASVNSSQATAASRPILQADKSLLFDGTDDSLTTTTGGGITGNFTICCAIKPTGGNLTSRNIWSDSSGNNGRRLRLFASNQVAMQAANGAAFTTIGANPLVAIGETKVCTGWDDGTNLFMQIDDGTIASVARPVVTAGTASQTIGKDNGAATNFFFGSIWGLAIFNRALSADERAGVKNYMTRLSSMGF